MSTTQVRRDKHKKMKLLTICAAISNVAPKKECQAERLLEKIQDKYDELRSDGATCSEINYQQHNLCSLLLATAFQQR